MKREERAQSIIKILKKEFPEAKCALDHATPFQLLVATILSAQCTDERVNKVTPELFKRYPDAKALSLAPLATIEELIHSTGFYHNKANSLIGCAQALMQEYNGEVPQTLDELVVLPGVGRKTANVVLGNCFNIAEGVVVDTHVKRISFLLGLTKQTNVEKIEQDLMKVFKKQDWVLISHLIILHGRKTCIARRPKCSECVLQKICPSFSLN